MNPSSRPRRGITTKARLRSPFEIGRAVFVAFLSSGPIAGFVVGLVVAVVFDIQALQSPFDTHPRPCGRVCGPVSVAITLGVVIATSVVLPFAAAVFGFFVTVFAFKVTVPFALIAAATQALVGPSRRLSAAVGGLYGAAVGWLHINLISPKPEYWHAPMPKTLDMKAFMYGCIGVVVGACLPKLCMVGRRRSAGRGP